MRRWSPPVLVVRAILFGVTVWCGTSLLESNAPPNSFPEWWEGTIRFAAMPGCDYGPFTGRSGVTINFTARALKEDGDLTIVLPHAPNLSADDLKRILTLSGDIKGRVFSGHKIEGAQEITVACLAAPGRPPLPSEVRKDRIQYRGDLTSGGKRSDITLTAKVTPCPESACSFSIALKLKSLPGPPAASR